MRKDDITKVQGKVATKSSHGLTAALVLDTTALYIERRSWGTSTKFVKTTRTACIQDRLGCVTTGWLVMQVSAITWTADIKARVAAAESFIKNFTGTVADVLNEDGSVNRNVVPSDVVVTLVNNRNLVAREVEPEPVVEVVAEVEAAPVKRLGKAQARVLSFLAAHKGEALTVSAIVKALGELGEKTWYNATNTALKALAADTTTGVVEGEGRTYTFQG